MKKVLILGVAAVQMDAINCLNEMGIETFAVAMANDGPGSKVAHHFEMINFSDEVQLEEYIQSNKIDAVYSVGSDLAMPVALHLSEKLGLPHFISSDVADICNNKNLFRETLGKGFVGNPNFQVLSAANEVIQLAFPFIIKPADSQGQRGVRLVHNQEEFSVAYPVSKQYSRTGLVIVEQYIDGPEFSVNGYLIDDKLVFEIASDRDTWPQYIGLIHRHLVPSRILSEEIENKMQHMLRQVLAAIGITNGPFYAQIKVMNDQPYIIEVTPRLDGCHMWKLIQYHTGMNLLKLTFEHLLENNTSELLKINSPDKRDDYVLEFICQEPNTRADYLNYENEINQAHNYYMYYDEGDIIRPVNNQLEKIGYMIFSR